MRPDSQIGQHFSISYVGQGQTFVAAHSIHALAVIVPIAVIVLALYWEKIADAWKRRVHHRHPVDRDDRHPDRTRG